MSQYVPIFLWQQVLVSVWQQVPKFVQQQVRIFLRQSGDLPVSVWQFFFPQVSRSQARYTLQDSSGRVISPTQRPLPDNTQHSQETDIHALDEVRAHNPWKRAAADSRLRPSGHWNWHVCGVSYRICVALCTYICVELVISICLAGGAYIGVIVGICVCSSSYWCSGRYLLYISIEIHIYICFSVHFCINTYLCLFFGRFLYKYISVFVFRQISL